MSFNRAPADFAHLNALLELINSSVQEIVSTYNAKGHDVLTLDSVDLGPFDSPENTPPTVTKAIQIVEGACAQLCATIAPPGLVVSNKAHSFHESACMRIATSAKISDHLLDKPQGLHVNELGKLCGIEPGKLNSALRLLATKHVYCEVRPDVYANNRLSMKLLSTDPVSDLVGCVTDEVMKTQSYLLEGFQDKEYGPSYALDKTVFHKVYGTTFFEFEAANPEYEQRFSNAMIGQGTFSDKGLLSKMYTWSDLPQDTVICDIGGGTGHASLDLLKAYPHFKAVVQDAENVRVYWNDLWSKQYPEAVEGNWVKFVPIDFFKDTPVDNCDYYYIRNVLHDWPEPECVKILGNIKAAMKASSRILIHEYVLQGTTRSGVATESSTDFAPEPLLPNYGVGRIRRYAQDLNVLGLLNGRERTLQEFLNIGSLAGLKFVKCWDSAETALVEFALPA